MKDLLVLPFSSRYALHCVFRQSAQSNDKSNCCGNKIMAFRFIAACATSYSRRRQWKHVFFSSGKCLINLASVKIDVASRYRLQYIVNDLSMGEKFISISLRPLAGCELVVLPSFSLCHLCHTHAQAHSQIKRGDRTKRRRRQLQPCFEGSSSPCWLFLPTIQDTATREQ